MYVRLPSQREQWQQIIGRKIQDIRLWVSENLDGTEEYSVLRDSSGLSLWVAIRSVRAKELLVRLHQDVFSSGFAPPKPSLDESGVWKAWFGYMEPVDHPTHYVTMR